MPVPQVGAPSFLWVQEQALPGATCREAGGAIPCSVPCLRWWVVDGGQGWEQCPRSALDLPAVPKECGRAEFPCRSGQCVALALRCDGDHDCRDGSDEEGCTVPRPLLCRMGEVVCPHSRECVLEAWRCDGATDCGDGTDEQVSGVVGTQPAPTHSQEGWWPCSPSALCRAVPGRKGCVGTSSGAAPMAMSASLMSGTVTERVTAQMAAMRLAVSNTLLLSPLCLTQGWLVGAQHRGRWGHVCAEAKGPVCCLLLPSICGGSRPQVAVVPIGLVALGLG